jgi:uncharacterized protein
LGSIDLKEIILACGHGNISAMHDTTIQITKEHTLSRKGDCIIAVGANRSVHDLTQEFKNRLRKDDTKIVVRVEVGGISETIVAYGDSRLILAHPMDTVIRKSGYICNRTLAIHADKSASDLSRELVSKMQDFRREVKVTLTVEN